MAKLLLFIALCVLPALISAARIVKPQTDLMVQGHVYCDRCRAGFETPKTSFVVGALVKVVCSDRKTGRVVYEKEGYTDSEGKYNVRVSEDHLDQICDALLVNSNQEDCATKTPGRERSRVILTNYNGLTSTTRFANAMGFMTDKADDDCGEMMKMYQVDEEEDV